MTTTYVPQPGTIPARVLAYLQRLPTASMVPSAVLAHALELGPNIGQNIGPYLKAAFEGGAIAKELREGRAYWGLPTGAAIGAGPAVSADEDDDPIVQRVVDTRPPTGVALPDVPAWAAPESKKQRRPRATAARPAPPACDSSTPGPISPLLAVAPYKPASNDVGMRCALWSDGQLQIQRGVADLILFTAEETKHLVRYLERLAEASE